MEEQNTASVDDLVWAREMLRTFSRLDKSLRTKLDSFGVGRIVIRNPLFIALMVFSIIVAVLGGYLFIDEKDVIYLGALGMPIFAAFYVFKSIRDEKQKNIFRFIGKSHSIPPELLDSLLNIVEEVVFKEKERFENIIAWRINLAGTNDLDKFAHMFSKKTWENIDTAQQQCVVLAILMVSLQRFLHNNRDTYNEHVKKIPLMNAGYNYKPSKEKKIMSAADIQTFGFTDTNGK